MARSYLFAEGPTGIFMRGRSHREFFSALDKVTRKFGHINAVGGDDTATNFFIVWKGTRVLCCGNIKDFSRKYICNLTLAFLKEKSIKIPDATMTYLSDPLNNEHLREELERRSAHARDEMWYAVSWAADASPVIAMRQIKFAVSWNPNAILIEEYCNALIAELCERRSRLTAA